MKKMTLLERALIQLVIFLGWINYDDGGAGGENGKVDDVDNNTPKTFAEIYTGVFGEEEAGKTEIEKIENLTNLKNSAIQNKSYGQQIEEQQKSILSAADQFGRVKEGVNDFVGKVSDFSEILNNEDVIKKLIASKDIGNYAFTYSKEMSNEDKAKMYYLKQGATPEVASQNVASLFEENSEGDMVAKESLYQTARKLDDDMRDTFAKIVDVPAIPVFENGIFEQTETEEQKQAKEATGKLTNDWATTIDGMKKEEFSVPSKKIKIGDNNEIELPAFIFDNKEVSKYIDANINGAASHLAKNEWAITDESKKAVSQNVIKELIPQMLDSYVNHITKSVFEDATKKANEKFHNPNGSGNTNVKAPTKEQKGGQTKETIDNDQVDRIMEKHKKGY